MLRLQRAAGFVYMWVLYVRVLDRRSIFTVLHVAVQRPCVHILAANEPLLFVGVYTDIHWVDCGSVSD